MSKHQNCNINTIHVALGLVIPRIFGDSQIRFAMLPAHAIDEHLK